MRIRADDKSSISLKSLSYVLARQTLLE